MLYTCVNEQQQNSRKTNEKNRIGKLQHGEHSTCSKHTSMSKSETQDKLEKGAE
jgi:hypothetical protein